MDGPLVSRYLTLFPNPSIRGVGAPMDGLSAAMDGPLVSRYLTLPCFSRFRRAREGWTGSIDHIHYVADILFIG